MLKGKHQLHFSLCGSQKYESQYEVIQKKKTKTLKSLSVKAFKLLEKKKKGGGAKHVSLAMLQQKQPEIVTRVDPFLISIPHYISTCLRKINCHY